MLCNKIFEEEVYIALPFTNYASKNLIVVSNSWIREITSSFPNRSEICCRNSWKSLH